MCSWQPSEQASTERARGLRREILIQFDIKLNCRRHSSMQGGEVALARSRKRQIRLGRRRFERRLLYRNCRQQQQQQRRYLMRLTRCVQQSAA
jgi:hypothetical protein